MFLDAFMNTSESSIPDLNDLQLECAVSLETAYNDFMLEGCQLEFQAICEGRTEILNEGILSSISNFFKKIWRMICKVFGFGDGGGSSSSGGGGGGGGASPENISKCRARSRKFMTRPESEIRKRLESWKQIKIYSPSLFSGELWKIYNSSIDKFRFIIEYKYCKPGDEDHEYDQNDSNHVLEEIFKDFTKDHHDVQIPQDISVQTICSTYSNHIKNVLPKKARTLYDVIKYRGIDLLTPLGQKIDNSEIDIKKAMSAVEEDLEFIESYVTGYNEKTWKKIIDSLTKEAEECAKTKPKTSAFMCKMVKEFFQIVIYVCNINRSLCASFINTLYRALK